MKPSATTGHSRQRRTLKVGLSVIILACISFWALNSHEPVFQKKNLSTWIRQLNEGNADEREAAVAAVRAMKEPAVPALITLLKPRNGRPRNALIWLDFHFPSLRDKHIPVEIERGYAASGLGAIGPYAKDAIPALITASKDTNSFCAAKSKAALIQIRQDMTDFPALPPAKTVNLTNWLQNAEILLSLGSNVQASADNMVLAIGNNNAQRIEMLEMLGRNNREPNASVLLLRGLLADKEPGVRGNVLNMLMMQRVFAKAARNDIVQCTNDANANVRNAAVYALWLVFPEQAASVTSNKGPDLTEPQAMQRK